MKRFRSTVPPLLALALAALLAGDASAQKSTIQSRGGGSSSSGRGSSIGSGRSAAPGPAIRPSGGASVRSPAGSVRSPGGSVRSTGPGSIARSPTVPSDFPLRGRNPVAMVSPRTAPSGGLTATAPRGMVSGGKKYVASPPRTPSRSRSDHGWIHRRPVRRVTHVIHDPFFYDPFLRYSRFDRYRYFSGFGCGFYDRWYPGYFGYRSFGYNPCFSSFSLFLGWPGLHDPWPGFWSWGYYRDLAAYQDDYPDGFADGYARGYASGQSTQASAYAGDAYAGQTYAPGVDTYGGQATPGDGGYADAADPGQPYAAGAPGATFESAYGGPTSASYEEGRRRMASGDYEAGLTAFDAYVREASGDPLAHLSRGVALTSLGHYGKAAEAFRRGLDAYQPWQRPYLDAPAFFASRSEFRAVEDGLEAYVQAHADDMDARFDLGVMYLFSGQRDAAGSLLRGLGNDRHARYLLEGPGSGG